MQIFVTSVTVNCRSPPHRQTPLLDFKCHDECHAKVAHEFEQHYFIVCRHSLCPKKSLEFIVTVHNVLEFFLPQ
jgi:hypothetical protein